MQQKHCLKEKEYTYTVEETNERHRGGKKQTKNNTLDAYKVNCKKIWLKYIFNKFWETLDFKRKFKKRKMKKNDKILNN